MAKVYMWGTGKIAQNALTQEFRDFIARQGYEIIGYIDSSPDKVGSVFDNYKVYSPDILRNSVYDNVIICAYDEDVVFSINKDISLLINDCDKVVIPITSILKNAFYEKNKGHDDYEDRRIIEMWDKGYELSVFNGLIDETPEYDEVFYDETIDLPYINFRASTGLVHRMYYPKEKNFININGKKYVKNLMLEQRKSSPHLYVTDTHYICEGDVIADVGVCEGNFALKYADIASKIYLFEGDPKWYEPLRETFAPFKDKVQFINKYVSDETVGNYVRIDDVIKDEIDFLKMDIEGFEEKALKGTVETLKRNRVKCSICTYHRYNAAENIKNYFKELGYNTTFSNGKMIFVLDKDTWKYFDFRKGILYAY